MSLLMLILIVLTVICLIGIIFGYEGTKEDSAVALFLLVIIGWIACGLMIPVSNTSQLCVVKVFRDTAAIHISYNNRIVATFEDAASYNYLKEESSLKMENSKRKNMYGMVVIDTWNLPKLEKTQSE